MLTDFCLAAWLSLRDVIRTRLGTPNGQPGVIIAIQTFGDYLNFHPHLHILITDGAFALSVRKVVRYYGAYSNRARGERRKQAANAASKSAANTPLPIRRSYADFAKEQEQADHEQRAQTFTQGLPLDPHPDACLPPVPSVTTDSIEVIELPRNAIPRIPRKKWRELIQKVNAVFLPHPVAAINRQAIPFHGGGGGQFYFADDEGIYLYDERWAFSHRTGWITCFEVGEGMLATWSAQSGWFLTHPDWMPFHWSISTGSWFEGIVDLNE